MNFYYLLYILLFIYIYLNLKKMQFLTNIQRNVIITLKQTNKTRQYIIDFMRSKHDVTVSKSGMLMEIMEKISRNWNSKR